MALDSNLQQALAKYNQGPVAVVIDPDGTPVELFVEDGIDLSFIRGQEAVSMDTIGQYDIRTSGDGAEFTLRLPEMSMNVVNVLYADGVAGTDTATSKAYRGFGRTAGFSMRTLAKKIRIRPWQTRNDATEQVIFWKAIPQGNATLALKKTAKYQYEQQMRALVDPTQLEGQLIARIFTASRS